MLGYPCPVCIVNITCSEECDSFRGFLEDTSDKYYLLTADELASYRELPKPIKARIFDMAFVDGRARKMWKQKRREELYGKSAAA
jgi:hypothetical protein